MKRLLCGVLVAFLAYCTNPVKQEPLNYEILLTGKVLDKDGKPVTNAVAVIPGRGLSDTTGTDGVYTIMKQKNSSVINSAALMDESNPQVDILKDGQIITTYKIHEWVDTLPDLFITQRDIYGDLLNVPQDSTYRMNAVITSENSSESKRVELWYNSQTNSFSGFVYFVYSTEQIEYALYVEVLNEKGALVGRSAELVFPTTAGDIRIATFSPEGAYPEVSLSSDFSCNFYDHLRDSITLTAEANDPNEGGSIISFIWALDGENYLDTTSGNQIKTVFASDGEKVIRVKAMDNDSLVSDPATCTVTLTLDKPVVHDLADTTAVINRTVILDGNAEDTNEDGEIAKYEWKIGEDEWAEVSRGDTSIQMPSEETVIVCRFRVTDDDGETAEDSMRIQTLLSPPTADAGDDFSVLKGDTIHLDGRGADDSVIVRYQWRIGDSQWKQTSGGDTVFTAPFELLDLVCSLSVEDIDGNVSKDEVIVTVKNGLTLDDFESVDDSLGLQNSLGEIYGGGYWFTTKDHEGSSVKNANDTEVTLENTASMQQDGYLNVKLQTSTSSNDYPYAGVGCRLIGDDNETYVDLSQMESLSMRVKGTGTVRVYFETKDYIDNDFSWGFYGKTITLPEAWETITIPVDQLVPDDYSNGHSEGWTWDHGKDAVRSLTVLTTYTEGTADVFIDHIRLIGVNQEDFGLSP